MKKSFLLAYMILQGVCGQAQVQSKAFRMLINKLLSHTVTEISVEEAHAQSEKIVFIDARERREYEVSHLRGAVWVGADTLNLDALEGVDKLQKIVVYCSIGYRSEKAAEKILERGYMDVSNLYGGIFEWKNRDYPIENSSGATDNIHAYSRVWGIWLKKGKKVYK